MFQMYPMMKVTDDVQVSQQVQGGDWRSGAGGRGGGWRPKVTPALPCPYPATTCGRARRCTRDGAPVLILMCTSLLLASNPNLDWMQARRMRLLGAALPIRPRPCRMCARGQGAAHTAPPTWHCSYPDANTRVIFIVPVVMRLLLPVRAPPSQDVRKGKEPHVASFGKGKGRGGDDPRDSAAHVMIEYHVPPSKVGLAGAQRARSQQLYAYHACVGYPKGGGAGRTIYLYRAL